MEVVEEVIVAPRRLWWRTSVDCLWLVVGVDNRGQWCNWVQLYTGGLIILLIHSCSNQNNSLGGPLYFGQIYLVKPITYLIACEINGYLSDLFTRILVITPSQQNTEYLGWVSVVVGCWREVYSLLRVMRKEDTVSVFAMSFSSHSHITILVYYWHTNTTPSDLAGMVVKN